MTLHDLLTAMGIDPSVLASGTAGGLVRALSRKRFKVREMLAAPICGALAAAYLTLPVVHYIKATGWPVPAEDAQVVLASAFLIGTCAMWIADLVFEAIVRRMRSDE